MGLCPPISTCVLIGEEAAGKDKRGQLAGGGDKNAFSVRCNQVCLLYPGSEEAKERQTKNQGEDPPPVSPQAGKRGASHSLHDNQAQPRVQKVRQLSLTREQSVLWTK